MSMASTHPRQHGFTLIELMFVIAVIGVLAAIAIPVYNDYTTRARVAQVLTAIDALRTAFHAEYETQGRIPTFKTVKAGEIPPELAHMSIGPGLLRFDYLDEYLIQSSHHYGPFEGKDIPYLLLKADDPSQLRFMRALAHELPHSAYAWMIEPTHMVVPLLDAEARHDSLVQARQDAAKPVASQPPVQPQPAQAPAQPLSCAPGQERVTLSASMSPIGSPIDICLSPCEQGKVRDPANPFQCTSPGAPTSSPTVTGTPTPTPCPNGLQRGADGKCHSILATAPAASSGGGASGTGGTPSGGTAGGPSGGASSGSGTVDRTQYDDCVAHVLADHPHGHAYGLLNHCNRYPH